MFNFPSWLIAAIIIGFLSINFFICSLLSYWGTGIQQIGPRHIRTGSVSGPIITGGGPGTGK